MKYENLLNRASSFAKCKATVEPEKAPEHSDAIYPLLVQNFQSCTLL